MKLSIAATLYESVCVCVCLSDVSQSLEFAQFLLDEKSWSHSFLWSFHFSEKISLSNLSHSLKKKMNFLHKKEKRESVSRH